MDVPTAEQAAGVGAVAIAIYLLIVALMIIATWKIFTKAGQPGWACIIPFYNYYILTVIAGKPVLWFVLLLVPFVNFIVIILLCIALAERFGKSAGFGIGLAFLGIIFAPILAFSDAKYLGGDSMEPPAPPAAVE